MEGEGGKEKGGRGEGRMEGDGNEDTLVLDTPQG